LTITDFERLTVALNHVDIGKNSSTLLLNYELTRLIPYPDSSQINYNFCLGKEKNIITLLVYGSRLGNKIYSVLFFLVDSGVHM
jgi:hypothetical protein